MNDEDERVTEFVQILSSAVKRKAENKALRAQRDELLEALKEIANMGVPVQKTEHRIARAAIAKAKGGSSIRGTSVNLILLDEIADRGE